MNLKNLSNQYQVKYPGFDTTPKAVIAAIAFSFALRLCEDDYFKAQELILKEWHVLNSNNIVPQKAPVAESKDNMIKFIIDTVSSKRDLNGNSYHAATITRLSNGATLQGTIDNPYNIRGYLLRCKAVEIGANEYHETDAELPIRQFNRLVKGFSRLDEKAIAAFAKGET